MSVRIATILICASALAVFVAGPAAATPLPAYNVTNLGTLSGTQVPWNYGFGLSGNGSYAVGGCISATSPLDPSSYITVGYRYNGAVQSLGSVPPSQSGDPWGAGGPDGGAASTGGINNNMPWAVNDSGTVAGQYNGKPFYSTGGGAPVAIPGTPSGAAAYGINNNGLIVGDWTNAGSSGFIYNLGTSQLTQISMAAYGVSSNGVIAGSDRGWSEGAWRNTGGTIHNVSNFWSFTGVSSNGTYLAGLDSSDKPAIYDTANGQTTEVGPAGGSVPNAWSVNSSGVAVGTDDADLWNWLLFGRFCLCRRQQLGDLHRRPDAPSAPPPTFFNGWPPRRSTTRARSWCKPGRANEQLPNETFLLTPVPEPSTLLLIVAGLAGLAAYVWRQRK